MPNVLIADDEPLLREQLRTRLRAQWLELERIDEASNGLQAAESFEAHEDRHDQTMPVVCFLDIHMPCLSGLEAARRIRGHALRVGARPPLLVFITAFDAHAIEAFEHGAIDYLLKPFETERLAQTIERVKERLADATVRDQPPLPCEPDVLALLADRLARLGPAPRQTLQWIKASIGSAVRLIPVEDVLYFHADDKYTSVVTADGEALIRKPIKELVNELDGSAFWQIHRGTIVNTRAIAGVVRGLKDSADLKLKNHPTTLTVSRAYLHLFRQM